MKPEVHVLGLHLERTVEEPGIGQHEKRGHQDVDLSNVQSILEDIQEGAAGCDCGGAIHPEGHRSISALGPFVESWRSFASVEPLLELFGRCGD